MSTGETHPLKSLSTLEVCRMLHRSNLRSFSRAFRDADISGEMLTDVTEATLQALGLLTPGMEFRSKQFARVVKRYNVEGVPNDMILPLEVTTRSDNPQAGQ